jgi:hypothetical protein
LDFTYFIAAFLAFVVGFCGAVLFVLQKRQSVRRLIGVAFVASLVVNGSTLINWSAVGKVSPSFSLLDCAFIAAYSFVGCAIGLFPPLAIRGIWRWRCKRFS